MDDRNFLLTYFGLGLGLPNHAFYAMVKGHPLFFTPKQLHDFMYNLALDKKWILQENGLLYKGGTFMFHDYTTGYVGFVQDTIGGEPDEIFRKSWRMQVGHFFMDNKLVPFSEWIDSYIKYL